MMPKANVTGVASLYSRTDGLERKRLIVKGPIKTDIPIGDGKAGVTQTRGFKNWYSSRSEGLTVESTMSVSLTCGQSEEEIKKAAETASSIAEELAVAGLEEMGTYLDNFKKDTDERY